MPTLQQYQPNNDRSDVQITPALITLRHRSSDLLNKAKPPQQSQPEKNPKAREIGMYSAQNCISRHRYTHIVSKIKAWLVAHSSTCTVMVMSVVPLVAAQPSGPSEARVCRSGRTPPSYAGGCFARTRHTVKRQQGYEQSRALTRPLTCKPHS